MSDAKARNPMVLETEGGNGEGLEQGTRTVEMGMSALAELSSLAALFGPRNNYGP